MISIKRRYNFQKSIKLQAKTTIAFLVQITPHCNVDFNKIIEQVITIIDLSYEAY